MKKIIFLLVGIFLTLSFGCERDDICAETTITTPKLVIVFRDAEDPTKTKKVENFNAKAIDEENFYFETPVNDTIVKLPLKTSMGNTRYQFVINYTENTEEEDTPEPNPDEINFIYTPVDVFVSRACGYKTEFLELDANLIGEQNDANWIDNINVQQPNNIVNEFTTHLYIYH